MISAGGKTVGRTAIEKPPSVGISPRSGAGSSRTSMLAGTRLQIQYAARAPTIARKGRRNAPTMRMATLEISVSVTSAPKRLALIVQPLDDPLQFRDVLLRK